MDVLRASHPVRDSANALAQPKATKVFLAPKSPLYPTQILLFSVARATYDLLFKKMGLVA